MQPTLTLVVPGPAHEAQALRCLEEFATHGELLAGGAGLDRSESYADWLAALRDNAREETVHPGLVPAFTYFAVDSANTLVGIIDIRHRLNASLFLRGGHIGYCVRKQYRRRGCATNMLRLALEKCAALHMGRVLITCDKQNIASAKTILACGGVLENEVEVDRAVVQRYWINSL